MKNNFKRVLTLALFGLGLSGFFGLAKTTATYADEKPAEKPKVQIQISPVKNTVYLKGGDISDFTFNVSNIGTDPFDFKVYATPYSVSNEKYELNFSKESSRTQITRWTTFEDASGKYVSDVTYSVQPNETKVVKYRVTVPQDVPAGGQYAVIFAEAIPKDDLNSTGIKTVSRVGLTLYGKTEGETREEAKISKYHLDGFRVSGNIRTSATVENTGNTDFRATVSMKVEKLFGGSIFEDTKGFDVLPDTTRDVDLEWKDSPAFGIYRITSTISAGGKEEKSTKIVLIVPIFVLIILFMLLTTAVVWFIIVLRKRRAQKSKLII